MEKMFYRCSMCGNIVELVIKGGGQLTCCGQPMVLLEANTVDAAVEKHVPSFKLDGDVLHVEIGSVQHPMTEEHYIQWIEFVQKDNCQRVMLTPADQPKATFKIDPAKGEFAVYEYCNLHGLWKKDS